MVKWLVGSIVLNILLLGALGYVYLWPSRYSKALEKVETNRQIIEEESALVENAEGELKTLSKAEYTFKVKDCGVVEWQEK